MKPEQEDRLYVIFEKKIEDLYMGANLDQYPEEERDSHLIPLWRDYLKQLELQTVAKEDFYARSAGVDWNNSVVLHNPLYTQKPEVVYVMTPEFAEKILVLGLP